MIKFSTLAVRGASAAAFALLVAAAPAQAERDAGTSQTARPAQSGGGSSQPSAKPEQVKYCISDQITGSRMAKKVCKTKAQWEAEGVDLGGK